MEVGETTDVWLTSAPTMADEPALLAEQDSGLGCGQPSQSKCLILPSCMGSMVLRGDEAIGRETLEVEKKEQMVQDDRGEKGNSAHIPQRRLSKQMAK